MTKQRRTVTLEPEIDEYLSRTGVNASELVNELVKKHMQGDASKDQLLQFRIHQVESELDQARSSYERKQRELAELERRRQQKKEEQRSKRNELLSEATEALSGAPLYPDNPAVENWADKIGITPEELIEQLED